MNRLSTTKRVPVVSALVEGNSINAIVRMTGVAKHTVLKLIEDVGCACAAYHHNFCRVHKTLRVTPTMEAGLINRVWTLEDLLSLLALKRETATV